MSISRNGRSILFIGGIRHRLWGILSNGVNDLLVEPGDKAAVVRAIQRSHDQLQLRTPPGENARRYIEANE